MKEMKHVYLIECYDGNTTIHQMFMACDYPIDEVVKFAIKHFYNITPFSDWVKEKQEEHDNWELDKHLSINSTGYPKNKNKELSVYCFNHIPDITVKKVKVEELYDNSKNN